MINNILKYLSIIEVAECGGDNSKLESGIKSSKFLAKFVGMVGSFFYPIYAYLTVDVDKIPDHIKTIMDFSPEGSAILKAKYENISLKKNAIETQNILRGISKLYSEKTGELYPE